MTNRLLTIGWLACLVTALWIAALTPQAGGYELSLTDAYSPVFWAATAMASICSASILLILAARGSKSPWWVSGMLGIILTNVVILSLPLFRGYPVNDRTDAMNHIGYARDILASGKISNLDFYPAQHLLQAAIEMIGGTTSGQALVIVNLAFALLWTLGPALVVGRLTGDVRAAYLGAAFSGPFALLSYHTAIPSTLSAILIPVLLVLVLLRSGARGKDRAVTIIVEILLALFIVFFHPATTLYLIVVLIAFEIASRMYSVLRRRFSYDPATDAGFPRLLGLVAVMSVVFAFMYFSYPPLSGGIMTLFRWVFGERDRNSALSEALAQVQIARLPLFDMIRVFVNQFGVTILVFGFTCVFIAILIYWGLHVRRLPPRLHFMFACCFIVAIMAATVVFVTSSAERNPIRILRTLVSLGLMILPWWTWEAMFHRTGSAHWPSLNQFQRRFGQIAVSGMLFAMIVMGQLNVYENPRNGLPNPQVTNSELSGMAWLIQNRSGNYAQASIVPDYVPRFQSYFLGYAGQRVPGTKWWQDDIWLPSHFYNAEWKCIANLSPGETAYLALSDVGRIAPSRFPLSVRQFAHLYTGEDWQTLSSDQSVNKIYDNGGFEIWETNKESTTCR